MNLRELVETLSSASEKNKLYPGAGATWLLLSIFGAVVVIFGEGESLEKAERAVKVAGLAFPVAIALWQVGSFWDDWLFDPIFKPATDDVLPWIGRTMRDARHAAAWFLKHGPRPMGKLKVAEIEGVYQRAEKLYKDTNAWTQKVKPRLEWSKFCRSLIVLPLAVFLYDTFQRQLPRLTAPANVLKEFAWLAESTAAWSSLTLAIILAGLYVWLRVRHLEELYRLVVPGGDAVFQSIECFGGFDFDDTSEIQGDGYLLFVSRLEAQRVYRPGCLTAKSLEFLHNCPADEWQPHQLHVGS
jgi:hypothetical protein